MKNDYFNTFEENDIRIREDIELCTETNALFAAIDAWFDFDKKFGINTIKDDDVWVNLYCDYNPIDKETHIYYNIDTPQIAYEREYIPTDEEKELFINCIERACMKQNQMSCRDFYIKEREEQITGMEMN